MGQHRITTGGGVVLIVALVGLGLVVVSPGYRMMGGMMPMGGAGFGFPFMVLFPLVWIIVLALIVAGAYDLLSQDRSKGSDVALDSLRRRYVAGEIDETEFEEKRRKLE